MYPLYKFAKGETTMAQIKLTPEELRTSANRYTEGSENVTQVLTTLTNEQALLLITGMVLHLIALKHNSTNCLQKSKNLHNCSKISMHSWLKLLTSLSKLTKISLHKFTNFVITALGRQEPSYFCKD